MMTGKWLYWRIVYHVWSLAAFDEPFFKLSQWNYRTFSWAVVINLVMSSINKTIGEVLRFSKFRNMSSVNWQVHLWVTVGLLPVFWKTLIAGEGETVHIFRTILCLKKVFMNYANFIWSGQIVYLSEINEKERLPTFVFWTQEFSI